MIDQLTELEKTHEELTTNLADPDFLADQDAFREASKKLAEISPIVELFRQYRAIEEELQATDEMLAGLNKDDELFQMAQEERERLQGQIVELEEKLRVELTPKDPSFPSPGSGNSGLVNRARPFGLVGINLG